MAIKTFSSLIQRKLRGLGISVASDSLRQDLVKWTVETQTRKSLTPTDVHLVLFNSHTPDLARMYLEAKFRSICLIEANQECANRQKEKFVTETQVHAYHASVQIDLFDLIRKKEVDPRFLERIMQPAYGHKCKQTCMIGCVPFPNQQLRILDSLLDQAILHSRRVGRQCAGRSWKDRLDEEKADEVPEIFPPRTLFYATPFSLILFVSSATLCRLLCATDDRFEFFARPHHHFSFLFNTLFDVRLLGRGFDRTNFKPNVPEVPDSLYRHKLESLGYDLSCYYPVVISLKPLEEIIKSHVESSPELDNTLVVIELACWMQFTSKFTGSGLVNRQIESLFPEYPSKIELVFGPDLKYGDLRVGDFLRVFPKIRPLFRTPAGRAVLERYIGTLVKVDTTDFAD